MPILGKMIVPPGAVVGATVEALLAAGAAGAVVAAGCDVDLLGAGVGCADPAQPTTNAAARDTSNIPIQLNLTGVMDNILVFLPKQM